MPLNSLKKKTHYYSFSKNTYLVVVISKHDAIFPEYETYKIVKDYDAKMTKINN